MNNKNKNTSKKKELKLKDIGLIILQFMRNHSSKSHNYKQITIGIAYNNPRQRELVIQSLHLLLSENKISESEKGKYILQKNNLETKEGTIDFNQSGNAYVGIEGFEEDVFVHQKHTANAMQGDRVLVEISPFKNKLEAFVIQVIERKRTQFVGVLQYNKSKSFGFVVIKNVNSDIFVSESHLNNAKDGDKVLVKMYDWNGLTKNPEGEILQVFGTPGEHNTEIHAILAEYDLPYAFSPEVEQYANQLDTRITEEEIAKRRDMRNICTFTIDPKDAKDFDDALSFQKLENGNWEIGIHIADVSHYLQPGTPLDDEAYARATSVYLVDRVVPMLPEILSNEACSLRPNEEKYTFSAIFEMNNQAQILNQWFGRTVIYSDRRFTYEEAQERIETQIGDLQEEINSLNQLAKIMRAQRMKEGAIAFDRSELRFHLDENNNPTGVYVKVSKDSNHLVEEFMLLANKKVSEFISLKKDKTPTQNTFVYRIHDEPNPLKLQAMREFVGTMGYTLDLSSKESITKSLNQLLNDVKAKPEENMIETLAMRSMSKAVYSTDNIGHYGLSFDYYSHFTSPIRRYPDVIAHRLLQHYLDAGKSPLKEIYQKQCVHCSNRERLASDAERDSIKYMQVKFMEQYVGEEFEGVVSGATDWGIYVQIPEFGTEGMVRLKDMVDDSYCYNPKTFSVEGKRTGNSIQLGDDVRIKVTKANVLNKQLDFVLVHN